MIDLKLDQNNDLDLSNFDAQLASGRDQIQQAILIKLKWFLGEWFLDNSKGIPYFRDIFIKAPTLETIERLLVDAIRSVEGVINVTTFEIDINTQNRKMSIDFVATTINGDLEINGVEIL